MKQQGNSYYISPRRKPKTIMGVLKWHRDILNLTLYLEFKMRALNAAIDAINRELIIYVPYAKDPWFSQSARLALDQLNKLKLQYSHELDLTKGMIEIAHDTNEAMVGSLIKSSIGEEKMKQFDPTSSDPRSNLLHGTKGWMNEYALAAEFIRHNIAAFLTFGSLFDSRGIDVIAGPSLRSRVKFRLPVKRRKKRRSSNSAFS